MARLSLIAVLLLNVFTANAQLGFERDDSVPVSEENGPLAFPWAGGINHPQVGNMDLNADGIPDIVVFDKTGDKIITLLMDDEGNLSVAPRYRSMFVNKHYEGRTRMHDWMLLRDFNCDGKMDIFTQRNGSVAVYRNDGNSDTLIFTLMKKELITDYQPQNDTLGELNVYVSPVDLPAIMDVDGDGDLDFVTFSLSGFGTEYHRNMSLELYGTCDSVVFELGNNCWGRFSEDPSTVQVNLATDCIEPETPTPQEYGKSGAMHSGFTMLGLDIEGDGDQDLVVSNVSFSGMNLITNGGSAQFADMTAQDVTFPQAYGGSEPIDIYTFPAAFLADVDNDGKDDLIGASYQEGNGNNYYGTWLYKNVGTNATPQYNYIKRNFLQEDMIELGTSAYPVFFDYDNDGLKDLLVGNFGYFIATGDYSAQLAYYRNTGTATEPAFTLIDRDLLDLSEMDLKNVAPTFGDIDGDGDTDLIIGDAAGRVHLFTNTAGPGNPCDFTLTDVGYQGINISGQVATPQLFDVDDDGLLDLVIGEMNGNLNFYRNEGTVTSPQFVLADASFGGIDTRSPGLSYGYSAPCLFKNGDETVMMVGSESGRITVYDNLTEVMSGPQILTANIGNGTEVTSGNSVTPFGLSSKSGRHQFLVKASELHAQGIGTGTIRKLGIEILNGPGVQLGQFYIKMGMTNQQELTGFETGLQTVHFSPQPIFQNGLLEFNFGFPLAWDGASNLVVEICWYHINETGGTDLNVRYSTMPYTSSAHATSNNFNGCNIPFVESGNKRPNFTLTVKPTFNLIGDFPEYEGERSVPAVADVNGDGRADLAIGNLAGGLAFYKGSDSGFNIGIADAPAPSHSLQLFPNPNQGEFMLSAEPPVRGQIMLRVTDLQGRVLWKDDMTDLSSIAVKTDGLNSGLYFLEISTPTWSKVNRFVVSR